MQSPRLVKKYTLLFMNGLLILQYMFQCGNFCSFRMTSFLRLL